MPDSDAERMRRSRAHQRGDHSLCVAGRCPALVTRDAPPLDAGGTALWVEMLGTHRSPAEAALIAELCRLKDRSDTFDALLRGDRVAWGRVKLAEDGSPADLIVDKLLGEARMTAVAMRGVVSELRQLSVGAPGNVRSGREPAPEDPTPEEPGGEPLDDLASRRARRIADAAGR